MKRVSKKDILISLPFSSVYFDININSNIFGGRKIINRNFFIRIPQFFRKAKFDGQHYWEIGRKNISLKKIRNILKQNFSHIEDFHTSLNPRQHFFILKK